LIDVSMLQRKGWNLVGAYTIYAHTKVVLRSSFRTITTPITTKNKENQPINLAHFSGLLTGADFVQNLLKISTIQVTILQNYYLNILKVPTKTREQKSEQGYSAAEYIQLFDQHYAAVFTKDTVVTPTLFLQLGNSALLLQCQTPTQPIYKLWVAFALFVQVGNGTALQVDKLVKLAEEQLFESFYEFQFTDFELFDTFYKQFSAKILQFMAPQYQHTISTSLQNIYKQLEIVPHSTWLKSFRERMYAD